MESLSHGTILPNTSNTLTIIVPHVKIGRSSEVDEILLRLGLAEHYLVASAADSLLYSNKRGILGEWTNDFFEELWEHALPSSFYEHGSDFEKYILINEREIYSYARWLLLQYQNLLFSAMNEFSQYYHYVAQAGGCVFLGTSNSLIVFGNHNNEYFDRFCNGATPALQIGTDRSASSTSLSHSPTSPYYVTRKTN